MSARDEVLVRLGALVLGCLATVACGSAQQAVGHRELALRHASLAEAAARRGQAAEAARRYDVAIAEARAIDDRPLVLRLLLDQGAALERAGRCDLAVPRANDALALAGAAAADAGPDRHGAARARLVLGACLAATDATAATAAIERAAADADGAPCLAAAARCGQGALVVASDPGAAAARYQAADALSCAEDSVVALCSHNKARLDARAGRHAAALAGQQRAAAAAARAGDSAALGASLFAAAEASAALGRTAAAADLARRAGFASWAGGRAAAAATAFSAAAGWFDASGDAGAATRCRADGLRALQQAETDARPAPGSP